MDPKPGDGNVDVIDANENAHAKYRKEAKSAEEYIYIPDELLVMIGISLLIGIVKSFLVLKMKYMKYLKSFLTPI